MNGVPNINRSTSNFSLNNGSATPTNIRASSLSSEISNHSGTHGQLSIFCKTTPPPINITSFPFNNDDNNNIHHYHHQHLIIIHHLI